MRVWVRLRESMPLASLRLYTVVGGVSPFSSELDLLFLDGWLCILSVSQSISFFDVIIIMFARTSPHHGVSISLVFCFYMRTPGNPHIYVLSPPQCSCSLVSYSLSISISLPMNRMDIKPSSRE
jgi:hypothetical protein